MWIKQEDVIEYVNDFLKVSLEDIERFSRKDHLSTSKKSVEREFLSHNPNINIEEFVSPNYDMLNKAFKTYCKKCWSYCVILIGLSGYGSSRLTYLDDLDITFEDGKVLEKDLVRVLKPLKKNYELALEFKGQYDNVDTFLRMTELMPAIKPYAPILNMSIKYRDNAMEMTEKQKREKRMKHDALLKKIIEEREEEQKKTFD